MTSRPYKKKEIDHKYRGLVKNIKPNMPRPQRQMRIVPTLEDLIYERLDFLLKKYKTKAARIRRIAREFNVDINRAKSAYDKAIERLSKVVTYQHYANNKDYYDWLYSPEFHKYMERYTDDLDSRLAENTKALEEKILRGEERIISVKVGRLAWYHGPESVYKRFVEKSKRVEKCSVCGKELEHNMIVLSQKLGAKTRQHWKCYECWGLSFEKALEIISFYKSSGCTLFE